MGIREKDWIQLSSYLDGELNEREEAQLKAKLAEDPQYQAALDQLRTAKEVLRSTPEVPVPRNFTLTPAQIGKRSPRPTAMGYRLAAATMTFLLIGTLVVDFGRLFLGGAMAPAAPKMEEVMLESAADRAAEPLAETEGELQQELAVGDALDEMPAEEAPPEVESAISEEEGAPLPAAEGAEEVLGFAAESPDEEKAAVGEEADEVENLAKEVPQPQATGPVLPTQTPGPQSTAGIEITITPTLEATDYYYPEEIIYRAPWYAGIPIFKILEILFGLGAIGFGTAAWLKRRRG